MNYYKDFGSAMKKIIFLMWIRVQGLLYNIFAMVYKIFGKKLTNEIFSELIQFIKFGLVGISNTVISYIIYIVSLLLLKRSTLLEGIDYLIAQVISFALSVLWSFYWNNKFVFTHKGQNKNSIFSTIIKTYISYSFTGLFLNSFLLLLWVNVFHISEFIGPIINMFITVPINYLMNKNWTFK